MTITSEPTEAAPDVSDLPYGWRVVRFDQMADSITDRVDNPSEAGVEYYVGLEHLDPDSLKIRRWGTPDDVEATKLRFKPGDIIFGRRRAYQRKLAVADFEGICSAHALVLRAREEVVLPDFLPFFMQSEAFFQRAMAISVGSLSPTINWKTLAQQEFAIPPIDEQRRIAEILWAAEEAIQQYQLGATHADMLQKALTTELTAGRSVTPEGYQPSPGSLPTRWRIAELGELLDICQYGSSAPLANEGRFPVFRMMNLVDGLVVANDIKYANFSEAEFSTYRLEPGDILFNRTNSIDLVGKVGIYLMQGEYAFASYLIRLRPRRDGVTAEYLNYYLNSEHAQRKIASLATPGVSQANINASNLKKLLIPVPPPDEQTHINALLAQLRTQRQAVVGHADHLRAVKLGLLRTLVGGQIGV
jgi:restriction endonuclease S subunit